MQRPAPRPDAAPARLSARAHAGGRMGTHFAFFPGHGFNALPFRTCVRCTAPRRVRPWILFRRPWLPAYRSRREPPRVGRAVIRLHAHIRAQLAGGRAPAAARGAAVKTAPSPSNGVRPDARGGAPLSIVRRRGGARVRPSRGPFAVRHARGVARLRACAGHLSREWLAGARCDRRAGGARRGSRRLPRRAARGGECSSVRWRRDDDGYRVLRALNRVRARPRRGPSA